MTDYKNNASIIKGLKISNETKCQISIIEGQGMASKQEVVESAIYLLYKMMPNDRNERKPLSIVIEEGLLLLQKGAEEEKEAESPAVVQ